MDGRSKVATVTPGFLALHSLIAGNAVTFGAWTGNSQNGRVRNAMLGHFLCSRWHLQKGRFHTLLSCNVFHQRLPHFAFNTYALWTVGRVAAEQLTNIELTALFAVCGLGSTSGHVLLHRQPVLGSSGLLMGILTTSSMLQPDRQFAVMPLPFTFSLADLAHLSLGINFIGFALRGYHLFGHVAWAAHITGASAGYGMAWLAYFAGDARFADPLAAHKHTMAKISEEFM